MNDLPNPPCHSMGYPMGDLRNLQRCRNLAYPMGDLRGRAPLGMDLLAVCRLMEQDLGERPARAEYQGQHQEICPHRAVYPDLHYPHRSRRRFLPPCNWPGTVEKVVVGELDPGKKTRWWWAVSLMQKMDPAAWKDPNWRDLGVWKDQSWRMDPGVWSDLSWMGRAVSHQRCVEARVSRQRASRRMVMRGRRWWCV